MQILNSKLSPNLTLQCYLIGWRRLRDIQVIGLRMTLLALSLIYFMYNGKATLILHLYVQYCRTSTKNSIIKMNLGSLVLLNNGHQLLSIAKNGSSCTASIHYLMQCKLICTLIIMIVYSAYSTYCTYVVIVINKFNTRKSITRVSEQLGVV